MSAHPASPRPASPSPDERRRAALSLAAVVAALCALIHPGHIEGLDGTVMFQSARALLDEHSLSSPRVEAAGAFGGLPAPPGPDGQPRHYSKYGLGPTLLMLPAVALAEALAPLAPAREHDLFETPALVEGRKNVFDSNVPIWNDSKRYSFVWYDTADFTVALEAFAVTLSSALVVGAIAGLTLTLAVELGASLGAATALGALLTLGSPLWHYGAVVFCEPLATALWVGAAVAVRRVERGEGGAFVAGLLLGAVGLTKVALLVLGAPLVLALVVASGARWRGALLRLGLGLLPPLLVLAAYNLARFGALTETGYGAETERWTTPFFEGLAGLLLSPGRGLFIYFPLALPAALLVRELWARSRAVAILAAGTPVALLLLYARWHAWEAGWSWGPRFLLPAVPLLGIALVEAPRRGPEARLVGAFAALGLIPALSGVAIDQLDYMHWLRCFFEARRDAFHLAGVDDYYPLMRWDWMFSPLVTLWRGNFGRELILPLALARPGVALGMLCTVFAGGAAGAVQLTRSLRARASLEDPCAR